MKNNIPNLSISPEYADKIKRIRLMLNDGLPLEKIKLYASCNDETITEALMTDDYQLQYRGGIGSIEYSEEDKLYYGRVQNVRDLVSYEGKTIEELARDFKDAIDFYLADSIEQLNIQKQREKKADSEKTWLVTAEIFGRVGCIAVPVDEDYFNRKIQLSKQLNHEIELNCICNAKYYRSLRPYTYTKNEEDFLETVRLEVTTINKIVDLIEKSENISVDDIKEQIPEASDITIDAALVQVHYRKINPDIVSRNGFARVIYLIPLETICELENVTDEEKIAAMQDKANISRELAEEELEIFRKLHKFQK